MGPNATPTYHQGADAETAASAVGEIVALTGSGAPVAVMLADDVPITDPVASGDTRTLLSDYVETAELVGLFRDGAAQTLATGDTTSLGALAYAASKGESAFVYSTAGLPDVGLGAIMSAQNLDNPQSIITAHGKALPGVTPTVITSAELDELERKRMSVYTSVGGQSAMLGGYTSRDGYWLDAVWFLMWFRNRMRNAIWAAQRRSRRFNRAMLTYELAQVAEAAVRNGGLQPNRRVNSALQSDIIASARATRRSMGFCPPGIWCGSIRHHPPPIWKTGWPGSSCGAPDQTRCIKCSATWYSKTKEALEWLMKFHPTRTFRASSTGFRLGSGRVWTSPSSFQTLKIW